MAGGRAGRSLSVVVSVLLAAWLLALAAADGTPPRQPALMAAATPPDVHPAGDSHQQRLALPTPPAPQTPRQPAPRETPVATPAPGAPSITPLQPREKPTPPRQDVSQRRLQPTASEPSRRNLARKAPAAPAPVSAPAQPPETADPAPAAAADPAVGRALLRMLEHGRGPGLEIAWPDRPAERERLYRDFQRCYGMRLALQDDQGRLYVHDAPPRTAWQPNGDRYSGFARLSTGRLTAAERRDIGAIARRHHLAPELSAVRIFPRTLDAHLLGSLQRVIGGDYLEAAAIRARYRLRNGQVLVTDLSVDGVELAGTVDLSQVLPRRCRLS